MVTARPLFLFYVVALQSNERSSMKEPENNWLFLIIVVALIGTAYLSVTHLDAFIEVASLISPH
jgi:hypothetical protein